MPASTKTLQPNEYSEDRKKALKEAEEDRKRRGEMGLQTQQTKIVEVKVRKQYIPKIKGELWIECVKCHKGYEARDIVWNSMLQRYGSVENIRTKHICRFCKKK